MGKYELLYIVHPDLESSIDKITDRVKSFITERSGKVTYEENWGKRKMAYEIRKSEVGIYILIYFEMPKESLAKVERDLKLSEEVMRFMILATPEKLKAKTGKSKRKVEESALSGKSVEETEKVKKADSDEVKKAEPVEKEAKKVKKTAEKAIVKKEAKPKTKKEPEPEVESEEERMKKLDEKLGAILGDEEDNKGEEGKEEK